MAASVRSRTGRDRVHAWLADVARRAGVRAVWLWVRQGDKTKVVGAYPIERGVGDTDVLIVARRAFRERRVVRRAPPKIPGKRGTAYVGLSLSLGGRPAVLVVSMPEKPGQDDTTLLQLVASRVLRRAEDAAVTSSFGARQVAAVTGRATPVERNGTARRSPRTARPEAALRGEAASRPEPTVRIETADQPEPTVRIETADQPEPTVRIETANQPEPTVRIRPAERSAPRPRTEPIARPATSRQATRAEPAPRQPRTRPAAKDAPRARASVSGADRGERAAAAVDRKPGSATPVDRARAVEIKTKATTESPGTAEALIRRQGAALGALASVLDHKNLKRSLHAFADGVAHTWNCQRVTIGLAATRHMRIEAVSGVVDFDRRAAIMVDIVQALEESRTLAAVVALPQRGKDTVLPRNHAALAEQLKHPALVSVPLVDADRVVGAMLLERDHAFLDEELQQLQQMALLVAPVIALKRLEAMGSVEWFARFARIQREALFGTSHVGWKLGALLALGVVAFGALFTQAFKVDAEASIEANVHRAVVAGFPSFLSRVEKRAGDVVYQGEVLAQLDVEELQLDRIKWVGERDKLTREYRATLAQRDRSNVRIVEARRALAQSQIDLLDAQIARATLRAPIDGVVVSGDLSQALGSPVERGQLLFEVASLDDYRLSLMVDETDIGWVEVGLRGNLRLRSLPEETFPFTVSAITPVSEPGQGANRFRVEASLDRSPQGLRPGMGGVAKIEVDERPIGWIWTRAFVDWLRFQLWKHGA